MTSTDTDRAIGEIAAAIDEVAQGTERPVQVIESAKGSVENIALAVADSAEKARQTTEAAERAREVAKEGIAAAEQATEAMRSVRNSTGAVTDAIKGLDAMSDQIGQIVGTITGLAEQTNLLALNAAIEAARAGERGGWVGPDRPATREICSRSFESRHQVVSDVVAAGRRATPLASAACATAGATALTTARLNTLGMM